MTDMPEFEFHFIGWCNEDNHDKVWTCFKAQDKWFCAWGRRGKKLQFKSHGSGSYGVQPSSLVKVERKKREKYKEVDEFLLFSIFPDFKESVVDELLISLLGNTVR
jgi:hypothetical protein